MAPVSVQGISGLFDSTLGISLGILAVVVFVVTRLLRLLERLVSRKHPIAGFSCLSEGFLFSIVTLIILSFVWMRVQSNSLQLREILDLTCVLLFVMCISLALVLWVVRDR
jgi:hypothetical protein